MAENKLNQSELNDEELQDEQLDNVSGGYHNDLWDPSFETVKPLSGIKPSVPGYTPGEGTPDLSSPS